MVVDEQLARKFFVPGHHQSFCLFDYGCQPRIGMLDYLKFSHHENGQNKSCGNVEVGVNTPNVV
jgi:hypothetical protein